MYQPIPNAGVSKLLGNGYISDGQRIIYIPSNAKMDYPFYVKQIQHLLCCCCSIYLIDKDHKK